MEGTVWKTGPGNKINETLKLFEYGGWKARVKRFHIESINIQNILQL
jgi:hypothetical protein